MLTWRPGLILPKRSVQTLFAENGLAKPYLRDMEERTLELYTKLTEAYENTRHLIPVGHLYEVRFEDLESDPLGQMRQVYDMLGLPGWQKVEPAIQAELPALSKYQKNTYNMDQQLMRKIYTRCRRAFELFGYPGRLPEFADICTKDTAMTPHAMANGCPVL